MASLRNCPVFGAIGVSRRQAILIRCHPISRRASFSGRDQLLLVVKCEKIRCQFLIKVIINDLNAPRICKGLRAIV